MAKNIPASAKREAIEKVKKTLAKEGIKLKDIKLAKGKAPKKPLKVVNPITGRKVVKGGPTFKKLVAQGFKFISVKKANRQMIAGILVPPKNVIERFAKENKVPEENVRQVVANRVANIASGIFGGTPVQRPNMRQVQNQKQRNALEENERKRRNALEENERKRRNALEENERKRRNALLRMEGNLGGISPATSEVRENIGAVRETLAKVPVPENKFKAVIGNAEQVVVKANENVLTQRNNREPRPEGEKAEPTPQTKINARPKFANVGNNRMGIAENNGNLATRNATSGAASPVAPVRNVRPLGNKTESKEQNERNLDRALANALAKIVE